MNLVSIELVGFKDLEESLKQLEPKVAKKYLDNAIREGLKIIKQSEESLAPKGTQSHKWGGRLSTSIGIYKTRRRYWPQGVKTSLSVKPLKKKGGGFALIVEYGTKPHMLAPKKKKALKWGPTYKEWVFHPGARAKPFMRPSWNPKINQVISRIGWVLANKVYEEFGTYKFQDKWVKQITW